MEIFNNRYNNNFNLNIKIKLIPYKPLIIYKIKIVHYNQNSIIYKHKIKNSKHNTN
jgi:hypothetical protein